MKERRGDRPTHIPLFFDLVAIAYHKHLENTLTEDQRKYFTDQILLEALKEANTRKGTEPAYFEAVLALCEELKPDIVAPWFGHALHHLERFHPMIARHIKRIAVETFGYEPVIT